MKFHEKERESKLLEIITFRIVIALRLLCPILDQPRDILRFGEGENVFHAMRFLQHMR